MPINMIKKEVYKIDYNSLSNELNAMKILNNPSIQNLYINKWIQTLKELDILACKDYSNPNVKSLMLKEELEAPENFQLPIHYKSNNMYIHFRVSRLIQILEEFGIGNKDAQNIKIEDFTEKCSYINWTRTNNIVNISSQPIIMAPLTLGNYFRFVVIDGNHRITSYIERKEKIINSICVDANMLVENNLFCTGFDKYLYIFQNEAVALSTLVHKDGYSDKEALELAYFSSRKVQCYI